MYVLNKILVVLTISCVNMNVFVLNVPVFVLVLNGSWGSRKNSFTHSLEVRRTMCS